MAKGTTPGKGVRSMRIEDRARAAADDLFEVCDAVVIVCVKFSGSNDNDEQVMRVTRGPNIVVHKAIDILYDYDESKIAVETYEDDDDE